MLLTGGGEVLTKNVKLPPTVDGFAPSVAYDVKL